MKRLYYLLLAACALFVLPQAAKAELMVKLVGDYNGTWGICTDAFTYKGDNTYTLDLTSNKEGKFYFRFKVDDWKGQMCPYVNGTDLMATSPYNVTYTDTDNGAYANNSFCVTLVKGKTYTFTFKNESARTVSCVESTGGGSTDTGELSVYLNGGYDKESVAKNSTAFTYAGNNTYTFEYTSAQTGTYYCRYAVSPDGGTNWWRGDVCPTVYDNPLTSTLQTTGHADNAGYSNNYFTVSMEQGKTYVFTFVGSTTWDNPVRQASCALKSGDTPTPTPTPVTKEYTEGYYLVGNFFNTDGTTINYDNGVFKFRQTSDDENGNARYMVEIPASLTAHAQVMAVGKNGKATGVYGPGSAYGVSCTNPATAGTISGTLTFSTTVEEGTNYWNMVTRNESSDNYTDGTYEITLTETVGTDGAKTITNWEIKHNALKRVAYVLSDAEDAVALPLYDARKEADKGFDNRFFATINLASHYSYYLISNILCQRNNELIDKAKAYGALYPNIDILPTTNKLFLLGNGGTAFSASQDDNRFSPNEKPMLAGTDKYAGSLTVEYNPSQGPFEKANTAEHFGIRGELQLRSNLAISAISVIGTAIPQTTNADGTWNHKSTAGDMVWDDNENCYKLTLATTCGDGKGVFRFVANHEEKYNWHEDVDNTVPAKRAKTPYDGDGEGHVANAADPNYVEFTQENDKKEEEYHITWNRPAGRYTIRFYSKTSNKEGNYVTDYYYTITANTNLELRDFEDVVYKSLDNKRIIKNRGDYRYFRTWSARKACKRPDNVDVFVVESVSNSTDGNTVTFSLKNINNWNGADDVIPANTGVILAVKKGNEPTNSQLRTRDASLTSYNTLVVPMDVYAEAGKEELAYDGKNLLHTCFEAQTIPTYNSETGEYNYLFGFYQANRGLGVESYAANEFLLGFWISGGSGAFYSNSAYLPVKSDVAEKMNLGVSYNDFDTTTGAKKVPALLFDFESLGDGGNGEVTGIKNVEPAANELMDNNYYTLGGQRIGKPLSRGIYIHNGKKYIVK